MELVSSGGRPVKTLAPEQLAEVERLASILNKSQLAAYFGMTEKTFHAIEERQPEVFTAYNRGKAQKIVEVAGALMKAVNRGDMRAIQFFLKTQAGWSEKNELQIEAVKKEPWVVKPMGQAEDTNVTIQVVDSVCPVCKKGGHPIETPHKLNQDDDE